MPPFTACKVLMRSHKCHPSMLRVFLSVCNFCPTVSLCHPLSIVLYKDCCHKLMGVNLLDVVAVQMHPKGQMLPKYIQHKHQHRMHDGLRVVIFYEANQSSRESLRFIHVFHQMLAVVNHRSQAFLSYKHPKLRINDTRKPNWIKSHCSKIDIGGIHI